MEVSSQTSGTTPRSDHPPAARTVTLGEKPRPVTELPLNSVCHDTLLVQWVLRSGKEERNGISVGDNRTGTRNAPAGVGRGR